MLSDSPPRLIRLGLCEEGECSDVFLGDRLESFRRSVADSLSWELTTCVRRFSEAARRTLQTMVTSPGGGDEAFTRVL